MSQPLVLVSGASGFVGAWVIRMLQQNGYRVRGTVRSLKNQDKVKHLYNLCDSPAHKLELVEADLQDEQSWVSAVKDCTYVHHVASPFPGTGTHIKEEEIIKPAMDGTLNVLKACAKSGSVKRVILTSSGYAIAYKKGPQKWTEEAWANPDEAPNPYAKSKPLAEKAAWDYVKNLPAAESFELATVNPDFIIGPSLHGNLGTSTDVIRQMMMHEIPALIPMCTGCIDVRDVALMHLKCMTMPEAAGNRHIVYNRIVYMKEMGEILAKEFAPMGYKVTTRVAPGWLINFAAIFRKDMKEAAGMVEESKTMFEMDNTRMRAVMKIEPAPIEKSLVDAAYALIELGVIPKTDQYKSPEKSQYLN